MNKQCQPKYHPNAEPNNSKLNQAIEITDKIHTWLKDREWFIENADALKIVKEQLQQLEQEAIQMSIERLSRLHDEARKSTDNMLEGMDGKHIEMPKRDRDAAFLEVRKVGWAIAALEKLT